MNSKIKQSNFADSLAISDFNDLASSDNPVTDNLNVLAELHLTLDLDGSRLLYARDVLELLLVLGDRAVDGNNRNLRLSGDQLEVIKHLVAVGLQNQEIAALLDWGETGARNRYGGGLEQSNRSTGRNL